MAYNDLDTTAKKMLANIRTTGVNVVDVVMPPLDLLLTLARREDQIRLSVGHEHFTLTADQLAHIRKAFQVPEEAEFTLTRPVRTAKRTGRQYRPFCWETTWTQVSQ